jgi:hypothetical protein
MATGIEQYRERLDGIVAAGIARRELLAAQKTEARAKIEARAARKARVARERKEARKAQVAREREEARAREAREAMEAKRDAEATDLVQAAFLAVEKATIRVPHALAIRPATETREASPVLFTFKCQECGTIFETPYGGSKYCQWKCSEAVQRRANLATRAARKITHPLEEIWKSMISRCHNPKDAQYKYYGGANPPVRVCDRWRSYETFAQDMGPRPPGAGIGRVADLTDYAPGWAAWQDQRQQTLNAHLKRIVLAWKADRVYSVYPVDDLKAIQPQERPSPELPSDRSSPSI